MRLQLRCVGWETAPSTARVRQTPATNHRSHADWIDTQRQEAEKLSVPKLLVGYIARRGVIAQQRPVFAHQSETRIEFKASAASNPTRRPPCLHTLLGCLFMETVQYPHVPVLLMCVWGVGLSVSCVQVLSTCYFSCLLATTR